MFRTECYSEKMKIATVIFVVIILCTLSPLSRADIYKYVDDQGIIHFTNIPYGKDYERIMSTPEHSPIDRFDEIISMKSIKYDIDPSIIKAIISAESDWDVNAVSSKGAMGLMQIMPPTAEDMQIQNPFDPEQNIEAGTKYLRLLLDRFSGDLELAIAAYNAGPATVEQSGGIPSYSETRKFVRNVISGHNKKSESKPSRIYKIISSDGTVIYTNLPHPDRF